MAEPLQITCTTQPVQTQTTQFDLGRTLQLLQSGLLIVTFVWALNERKRYRKADRFGKIVIDFVSDAFNTLYADQKKSLDDIKGKVYADEKAGRVAILSAFQPMFSHARTIVTNRTGCYSLIPQPKIDSIFEAIEDGFTLAVADFDPKSEHPEQLTAFIARGGSQMIAMLLDIEAELSGHRSRLVIWLRRKASRAQHNQ